MAGGVKVLEKDEILFRENDPSDAMYVIKKGRIKITKAKGSSHIVLAELGPGQMLGEMAFFDNKPRSAGAVAGEKSEVVILPFNALLAQFKTFPEWLKAMVKTVNSHLRDANQRIKNLEQAQKDDEFLFPPHLISKLCAIISLIGFKSGTPDEESGGIEIPTWTLRNYTIQIFQQPTFKMNRLVDILSELEIMKTEDLGEGNTKTIILKHELLSDFVDWYNKWLFSKEADKLRATIEEKQMPTVKALIFYGEKAKEGEKEEVLVNLTEIQNNSMRDLDMQFQATDVDPLTERTLVGEKVSNEDGSVSVGYNLSNLKKIFPYWEIVYSLNKVTK